MLRLVWWPWGPIPNKQLKDKINYHKTHKHFGNFMTFQRAPCFFLPPWYLLTAIEACHLTWTSIFHRNRMLILFPIVVHPVYQSWGCKVATLAHLAGNLKAEVLSHLSLYLNFHCVLRKCCVCWNVDVFCEMLMCFVKCLFFFFVKCVFWIVMLSEMVLLFWPTEPPYQTAALTTALPASFFTSDQI